jgi:hypothetical protein
MVAENSLVLKRFRIKLSIIKDDNENFVGNRILGPCLGFS